MLKLFGVCIVVLGSSGFGFSCIQGKKEALKELGQFIYFFRLLQSEITYHKESLPEAVVRIGKRMNKRMEEIFIFVDEMCIRNKSMGFAKSWHLSVEEYLKKTPLCVKEKNMLLGFSEYIGYEDKILQESMLKQYIEELEQYKNEKEEELSGKQRVAMGISTVLGLMISIILL